MANLSWKRDVKKESLLREFYLITLNAYSAFCPLLQIIRCSKDCDIESELHKLRPSPMKSDVLSLAYFARFGRSSHWTVVVAWIMQISTQV